MTIPEQTDITLDDLKESFGFDPNVTLDNLDPEPTPIREAQEALSRRLNRENIDLQLQKRLEKEKFEKYRDRLAKWQEATAEQDETTTQAVIREICDEFRDWLIAKNKQYGDSAIHPVRVFSSASDEEQLLVRIDDKLSRLFRGNSKMEPDADIMDDLLGYWILLKVLRRKAGD